MSSVRLTWPATVGATFYRVYGSNDGANFSLIADNVLGLEYVHNAGHTLPWWYRITSCNSQWESRPSTAVAPTNWPPTWPTPFSLSGAAGQQIDVSIRAQDRDSPAKTYSLVAPIPAGYSMTSAGVLTLGAASASPVLRVSDGLASSDTTVPVTITSASAQVKWNPGFYIFLAPSGATYVDNAAGRAANLTWFQNYANDPNIKGFVIHQYILSLERGTTTPLYDYVSEVGGVRYGGFACIDYYLGLCATYGKRLAIALKHHAFGTTSTALPTYWISQGWEHRYYSDFNSCANIGITACRDRYISLLQAYGARYDTNPYLEWTASDETTVSLPSGISSATWINNYKVILSSATIAWPSTMFRSCENGQLSHSTQKEVYEYIEMLNSSGVGCIITGGPDHEDTLPDPYNPGNEKPWTQLWRGETTSTGVVWKDVRRQMPRVGETQERGYSSPSYYQDTAANILTYQIDYMRSSHVVFLNYNKWTETYAAIAARSGLTDTTIPACLAGRIDSGGATFKWYPGQYPFADTNLYPSRSADQTTFKNLLAATDPNRNITGTRFIIPWGMIEPGQKGVFEWSHLDYWIDQYAQLGYKVYLGFWWQSFGSYTTNQSPPSTPQTGEHTIPDYIIQGGYWYISSTAKGVKFWLQEPMDHYVDFLAAVAARYDNDDRVSVIASEEATWGVPLDGSASATTVRDGTLAQCKRLVTAAKPMFNRTPYFLFNNFVGGQARAGELVEMQLDLGIGIATPDLKPGPPDTIGPTEYNMRYLRGERWNGTAWVAGAGPDQRPDGLVIAEKQVNRDMSWTPALCYAWARDYAKAHFLPWSCQNPAYLYGQSGVEAYRIPAMDRANVLAYLAAAPRLMRTDIPTNVGT